MRQHLLMMAAVAVALAVPRAGFTGQLPPAAGAAPRAAVAAPQAIGGGALFQNTCATCHAGTDPRIPSMAALRQRTPEQIIDALTTGPMREQGVDLSDAQRRAIAEYLSGGMLATKASAPSVGKCTTPPALDLANGPQWNGWSPDVSNTRFQSAAQAGLTAEQTPKLTLKWAFGFPNATSARAADRRRRTAVRRQQQRRRLLARREDRLHDLDVSREERGAHGDRHRPAHNGGKGPPE
ncbi:MAG: cytochrome c [Acidobacteria bacterium]|nr:cytochrome c [Acidobacteriota bacterium]